MFKKSAPVLLLGGVMLAVSCASMAQDKGGGSKGGTSVVPTVAGSGKVSVESLVQRYLTLAGSEANANSLVNGLRDGTEVTLTGTVEEKVRVAVGKKMAPPPVFYIIIYEDRIVSKTVTASFTPPTGNMGLGNVDIALALAQAVFTQKEIATPAVNELQTALVGENGILTLRARKMGWGDVAQALGFELK